MSRAGQLLEQLNEADDVSAQLKKLMDDVNKSKDFGGIKMSLERDVSNIPGPNNMQGKLTATFLFSVPFDADQDYTKQLQDFYKLNLEQVATDRYAHILRDTGERKAYELLKKVYAYFDKHFNGKINWSYQRAFGQKKAKYDVTASAQALFEPK